MPIKKTIFKHRMVDDIGLTYTDLKQSNPSSRQITYNVKITIKAMHCVDKLHCNKMCCLIVWVLSRISCFKPYRGSFVIGKTQNDSWNHEKRR